MWACALQCVRSKGELLDMDKRRSTSPHHTAETKLLRLGQPNNNNQIHLSVRSGDKELGAYGAD